MSFINNDIELDKELDNFYEDDEEIIKEKKEETFLTSLSNFILTNDEKYYIEISSGKDVTNAKLKSASKKNCFTQVEGESVLHALYLLACFMNKETKNKVSKKELESIKAKTNIDTKVVDDNTPIYITKFNNEYIQLTLDIPDVTNKNTCLGDDIFDCVEYIDTLLNKFNFTDEPIEQLSIFLKNRM